MKKSFVYFVQDAYVYLVPTDDFGFEQTRQVCESFHCKYSIQTLETVSYISLRLWRV